MAPGLMKGQKMADTDLPPDFGDKLEAVRDYKVTTVAALIEWLAGLPPMMDVWVQADGTSMYLNEVRVEEVEGRNPFLCVYASESPLRKLVPNTDSYEEALARQTQRAMEMTRRMDEARVMPPMVD